MSPPPDIARAAPAISEVAIVVPVSEAVAQTFPAIPPPSTPTFPLHANGATTSTNAVVVAITSSPPAPAADVQASTQQTEETDQDEPDQDKPGDDAPDVVSGECRLLGPFALFVQLALGALALLSLVYKRWRERPQRPVKIWFFDVSKQVFGSALVHVANVFMSMLTSGRFNIRPDPTVAGRAVRRAATILLQRGDDYTPNPCSFYLLNLGIDTTVGIPILIALLKLTTVLVSYTPLGQPPESIQSGNYGSPANAWWWLKQSIIYFCGLFGMKICVLIMFLVMPWIERVGDWALGWTEGNERLQIVFVMMLFPLIMNALQYYIIDSFIKKDPSSGPGGSDQSATGPAYEELPVDGADDDDNHDRRRGRGGSSSSDTDSDSEDGGGRPRKTRRGTDNMRLSRRDRIRDSNEYDPVRDADSQTVVGSSTGGSLTAAERNRLLPKEAEAPGQ